MPFNDPIAEFLTRIRNATRARHRYVDIQTSKMKLQMIEILKKQGFVENFMVNDKKKLMRIFLKYTKERKSLLQGLKRESSPGLRRYIAHYQIPRVMNGLGIAIVSTSKGVLEGEKARQEKVGGELLCTIW